MFWGPWSAFLIVPGLLALGVAIALNAERFRVHSSTGKALLWSAAVALGLLGVWMGRRVFRRIVVTGEGLEEINARGRRFFAWRDLRRIRDETEGYGRHQTRRYRVLAKGGRGLSFYDSSVLDAEGLASVIEDQIRAHRPSIDAASRDASRDPERAGPAVGLEALPGGCRPRGRLRRAAKRYRAQSKAKRAVQLLIGLVVLAAALWWDSWRR